MLSDNKETMQRMAWNRSLEKTIKQSSQTARSWILNRILENEKIITELQKLG